MAIKINAPSLPGATRPSAEAPAAPAAPRATPGGGFVGPKAPAKLDLEGVRIDALEARVGGVQLGWIAGDETGLAARIEQAGTPDGALTADEIRGYWNLMMTWVNEHVNKPELSPEEQATADQIRQDFRPVGELLEAVQRFTEAADLDATIAHRIDEAVVNDQTQARLGDGDGRITSTEVSAFIAEMTKRAARAAAANDQPGAEQLRGLVEVAQHLLAVIAAT